MTGRTTTVGLNIGHDGGCALVSEGRVLVAIGEERLARHKYVPGWASSLRYCLDASRTRLSDVDLFVFSSGGPRLPAAYTGGLTAFGVDSARVITVDHHLSHAIGSYCMSGFDEAAVIVCDAVGNDGDTETVHVASRTGITRVAANDPARPVCKGIGFTYEAFTNLLGFADQESGKAMALAAYGDSQRFAMPLFERSGGRVASGLDETHQWGAAEFLRRHGVPVGGLLTDHRGGLAQDAAAYVQAQTEAALTYLVSAALELTGSRALCFSGGVALNCVANSGFRDTFPGVPMFFLPPASDTGQALGNALYGYWQLTGELPDISAGSCYLGRSYTNDDIRHAFDRLPASTAYGRLPRWKFGYHRESDIAATTAALLAEGNLVGWFQGGSELGPRALGHRSILADPRTADVRDTINSRIKHREWFRPFAPSIAAEHVERYLGRAARLPHMLECPRVVATARAELAAALHIDGTARIQTVDGTQPRFHRLISEFYRLTGVPAVLNTSFNDREPIVETPGDALSTFLAGGLDYLVIGDYLVSKQQPTGPPVRQ